MTNSQIDDKVILRIPTIPRIHLVLFFLTVFTTLLAGALMEGAKVLENPLELLKGIPFSFTLMFILGTHEFGHYYYAQKHKVDATLPYFIPAPPFLFLIGTFGAFIKIKSPIYRKDALLQIGAAGPIAGFVIAVPALIIGLLLSDVVEKSNIQGALILGDSILMTSKINGYTRYYASSYSFCRLDWFISYYAKSFTHRSIGWRTRSICNVG